MASSTSGPTARAGEAPGSASMQGDVTSLSNDIADLKRELNRVAGMVGDMASNRYSEYREQASGVAGDLAERGAALRDEAYARASALEEEVERSVRERPLTAVAIAAGVGYLVGLLSRSSH